MPRVLRIINRLNLGGPTYNAAYLTKYMEPQYETLLVSGMKEESEESSEYIVENLGIKPVYMPEMYRELNPFKDYKSYYRLRKLIDEYKPDVVHTHAAKAGAVGRLAAIHSGVKVIVHTFHGHVFHSYFNPAKTRMFIEIERYLAKRTTAIVTLSDIQKSELVDTFKIAPANKLEIVPLGFDLRRFEEGKEEKRKRFRAMYNIADEEIAIGIVGRLAPVKNHPLFLNAIKEVAEQTQQKLRVFIIGDGEERPKLEALAQSLQLSFTATKGEKALITFTSWIKDIDVSNAGMDIIVLSSDNEGTPVSLIEAQASAKPIVSTNVGGIENVVLANETALLSERGNAQKLAQNILALTENAQLRHAMAQKGSDHVREKFSYTRLCSDMVQLYDKLLMR
jgi:glycosyltransferase involved in cell wall biosynthesis